MLTLFHTTDPATPPIAENDDLGTLTWLEPGVYTTQVSGVGETTGVVLVEVYEVK